MDKKKRFFEVSDEISKNSFLNFCKRKKIKKLIIFDGGRKFEKVLISEIPPECAAAVFDKLSNKPDFNRAFKVIENIAILPIPLNCNKDTAWFRDEAAVSIPQDSRESSYGFDFFPLLGELSGDYLGNLEIHLKQFSDRLIYDTFVLYFTGHEGRIREDGNESTKYVDVCGSVSLVAILKCIFKKDCYEHIRKEIKWEIVLDYCYSSESIDVDLKKVFGGYKILVYHTGGAVNIGDFFDKNEQNLYTQLKTADWGNAKKFALELCNKEDLQLEITKGDINRLKEKMMDYQKYGSGGYSPENKENDEKRKREWMKTIALYRLRPFKNEKKGEENIIPNYEGYQFVELTVPTGVLQNLQRACKDDSINENDFSGGYIPFAKKANVLKIQDFKSFCTLQKKNNHDPFFDVFFKENEIAEYVLFSLKNTSKKRNQNSQEIMNKILSLKKNERSFDEFFEKLDQPDERNNDEEFKKLKYSKVGKRRYVHAYHLQTYDWALFQSKDHYNSYEEIQPKKKAKAKKKNKKNTNQRTKNSIERIIINNNEKEKEEENDMYADIRKNFNL